MFVPVDIDPHSPDDQQTFGEVQPIDLDRHPVQPREVGSHPRRELGPGEGREAPGDGRFGKATARTLGDTTLGLANSLGEPAASSSQRGRTLSSFVALLRTRGRWTATLPPWKPIGAGVDPQR